MSETEDSDPGQSYGFVPPQSPQSRFPQSLCKPEVNGLDRV